MTVDVSYYCARFPSELSDIRQKRLKELFPPDFVGRRAAMLAKLAGVKEDFQLEIWGHAILKDRQKMFIESDLSGFRVRLKKSPVAVCCLVNAQRGSKGAIMAKLLVAAETLNKKHEKRLSGPAFLREKVVPDLKWRLGRLLAKKTSKEKVLEGIQNKLKRTELSLEEIMREIKEIEDSIKNLTKKAT